MKLTIFETIFTYCDLAFLTHFEPVIIMYSHYHLFPNIYHAQRLNLKIILFVTKSISTINTNVAYHSWTYSCNGKLVGTLFFNDNKMANNSKQRNKF